MGTASLPVEDRKGWRQHTRSPGLPAGANTGSDLLESAYQEQRSGVQLSGEGVVERIPPDDNDGRTFQ
jgi:hypothetical protein